MPISNYKVYRNGALVASPVASPHTDTGLVNGQPYTYQVSAVNEVGEGPKTSPITVTPFSSANPPLAAAGELQTFINSVTTGTTGNVPWKRYIETATVNRAMTLNFQSSMIDGQNVRQNWLNLTANNININELLTENAANANFGAPGGFQVGGISANGRSNIVISRSHFKKGPAVALNISGGTGNRLIDVEVERCPASGFTGGGGSNFKILSTNNPSWPAYWHHNRTSGAVDPLNEGGGIKTGNVANDIEISGQEVAYNAGPGIWYDIDVSNSTINNNNVHHNTHAGIFFEISRGTSTLHTNKVWENGWNIVIDGITYQYDSRGDDFGWPASILVSSSKEIETYNNIMAWNRVGLGFIYQGDRPDRQIPATQHYNHNNTIIGGPGRHLVTWNKDGNTPSTLFTDSSNRGANNSYYSMGGDTPANFIYQAWLNLAGFNATYGEENGAYITPVQKDSILTAAGIPLNPEAGH